MNEQCFELFVEGLQFEDSWSHQIITKAGDIVTTVVINTLQREQTTTLFFTTTLATGNYYQQVSQTKVLGQVQRN